MFDTITIGLTLASLMVQYILQPINFVLTILVPIAIYFINFKYIWASIPATLLVEVVLHWQDFCYYESQGLMILFTCAQIVVMALLIWILKIVNKKRTK